MGQSVPRPTYVYTIAEGEWRDASGKVVHVLTMRRVETSIRLGGKT